jgi:3-hydroxyisobutyrate dehydrogenase
MKAGFIGLGAMGAPMARNLAQADLLEGVWNRTASVGEKLAAELNVACPPSPAYLALMVDVVLICVPTGDDLLSVIAALESGLNPDVVVIDHSTVAAEDARRAAEIVRGYGADFLDAPVTGGVEGAKGGSLSMMVGGNAETLAKVRPILEAMATRIVHMGDVGAGQATKAVNQVMCAGINQAVTEALAFGAAQGLDLDKAIKVISGGAAGNWFLDKRGATMVRGTFVPGFKLALHQKDLDICLGMAEQLGINLPLTKMTQEEYAELIKQGRGNEDISALYRLKKPKK